MLKITVITVCFNEKDRLRKTIESVCGQTYPCIEYLIIDGASTDGTLDILKGYLADTDKDILVYSEKDYGIYNAMNRGIAKASGDYIYFINAGDSFYNESVVENVVSHIKDIDMIYYGKVCLIYADGLKQIQDFTGLDGRMVLELQNGCMPCHQAIFAPRDTLVNHYFREKYRIRADFEWLLHSVSSGYVCKGIPVIVGYYDTNGTSGRLKNSQLFQSEEREILQEYLGKQVCVKDMEFQKMKMDLKDYARKYEYLFLLMSSWLALKQKNVNIAGYFEARGYKHVAIYGMGHMGLRLLEELEHGGIWVDYGIDRNKDNICVETKLVLPDDNPDVPDVVVVTAVNSFYDVEKILRQKMSCPIISLEDIIYDMYEKLHSSNDGFV